MAKSNAEWRLRVHGRKSAWFDVSADKIIEVKTNILANVYCIKEGVFSVNLKSPGAGGDVWTHIVIGEEKVLVIDTGFGIGDLKGLVEELAPGKPFMIVNTHLHGDHTLGNYQFETAYCPDFDAPILKQNMVPEHWAERRIPTPDGFFTQDDVVPFKEYEIIPVPNGYEFDLGGGHVVELIQVGGHTPGNSVLLDKKNRILFSGDAIMGLTTLIMTPYEYHPELATVTTFKDRLEKLLARADEFDCLYPGHGALQEPIQLISDMIGVCDRIIADPADNDYDSDFKGRSCKQTTYGLASINYNDNTIV